MRAAFIEQTHASFRVAKGHQLFAEQGEPLRRAVAFVEFIGERTPAERVEKILALSVRSRAIECVDQAADLWRPLAKQFRSTE